MFSRVFPSLESETRKILQEVSCPPVARTMELLHRASAEPLELREIAELLEIGVDESAREQFDCLRSFTNARFRRPEGNRVRYIAPIYISSYCVDSCGYCNFSALRKNTPRKRLSLADLDNEVAGLMAAGVRAIELVLGTDPELSWRELAPYVQRTVELLDGRPGSGVLLCSEYFPKEAYAALHDAGLWGMVQWDETLDAEAYRRWHGQSPRKRHFEERMDCHGRAMAAGVEAATGALLGLADFRYETLMQIAKGRFLAEEYGRKPFVFGVARLKPISGQALELQTAVSDRAYETALMVYKIAEPAVGRWLQTRETLDLNLRNILHDDVFTYRCGEVTPGGHNGGAQSAAESQFRVHDSDAATVETRLRGMHFRIEHEWI
jgi:2-iminoacetate synthase